MLKKIVNITSALKHGAKLSYAQCGEDLIIDFIFQCLQIHKPSYLDIGAHHPTLFSNTYHFYRKGSQGVLVEADPFLCAAIKQVRNRDTCLNVGVGGTTERTAEFYVMTTRTLNTFSKEEAERYASYGGQKVEQVLNVPMMPVNQVLQKHFTTPPNLVSIDVEGMDLDIVQAYDFQNFSPEVMCVETLTYTENASERKLYEIQEAVMRQGYFLYADTYINSIFVRQDSWDKRLA